MICRGKQLPQEVAANTATSSHPLGRSCLQGFLYVLDCQGNPREGWPLQMGDIQGQVAVSDVNGDSALELVAADLRGNVAAFTIDGTEIWERHVASQVTQVSCRGFHLGMCSGLCAFASVWQPHLLMRTGWAATCGLPGAAGQQE